jgi:CxxC-x17-CxxC domain-containing protein
MEFQDQDIVCSDCNAPFNFTVAEQEFYQEKQLTHPPKRCKPCRAARKNQPREERGRPAPGGGPPRGRPGAPAGARDSSGPLFKANFGPPPGARGPRREPGQGRSQAGGRGRQEQGRGQGKGRWQGAPRRGQGAARQDQRPLHLFDAVCSDCSASTQVPFQPNGVQPVYCRACLPKYKAQRARNRAAGGQGQGDAQG